MKKEFSHIESEELEIISKSAVAAHKNINKTPTHVIMKDQSAHINTVWDNVNTS